MLNKDWLKNKDFFKANMLLDLLQKVLLCCLYGPVKYKSYLWDHQLYCMSHNMLQETKAQFARDDPAFLVLLAFWLVISSVGCFFVSVSIFLSLTISLSLSLFLSSSVSLYLSISLSLSLFLSSSVSLKPFQYYWRFGLLFLL